METGIFFTQSHALHLGLAHRASEDLESSTRNATTSAKCTGLLGLLGLGTTRKFSSMGRWAGLATRVRSGADAQGVHSY